MTTVDPETTSSSVPIHTDLCDLTLTRASSSHRVQSSHHDEIKSPMTPISIAQQCMDSNDNNDTMDSIDTRTSSRRSSEQDIKLESSTSQSLSDHKPIAWPGKIVNGRRREFYVSSEEEPHADERRRLIEAHPEVLSLQGIEPLTKYMVTGSVILQLGLAAFIQYYIFAINDMNEYIYNTSTRWIITTLLAYIIGATIHQSLFLATHELCHDLASKKRWVNQLIQVIGNIPVMIPYVSSYGPYHADHHHSLGHDGIDTDIPTMAEGNFFSPLLASYPTHCFMKFMFMVCQIGFYALRPLMVRPSVLKEIQKTTFYMVNTVAIILTDMFIIRYIGWYGIAYMFISTFFAGSVHPTAGHFLAEHYVLDEDDVQDDHPYETKSYYGIWNYFTYNGGYHREHHVLKSIPWSRLPALKAMAPEFFPDNRGVCPSWGGALIRFIFDDRVNPFRRVKRLARYYPDVPQDEHVLRQTKQQYTKLL